MKMSQYKDVFRSFKLYFSVYGGAASILYSPYLHASIIISVIVYPVSRKSDALWFDLVTSILPNLLGFTLGGYAILLAFGNEGFRDLITGKEKDGSASPFMKVNGAFIHFIVVQAVSILYAVIGKVAEITKGIGAWLGFVLLIYSLFTAVAAGLAILNLADWFDDYTGRNRERQKKQ